MKSNVRAPLLKKKMLFVLHLLLLGVVTTDAERTLLDMSHEYVDGETYYWWENQNFTVRPGDNKINGEQPDGSWYEDYTFCSGEHGGTHIDSPRHSYKDKRTLEQIPLSNLVDLPAVMVDMADKAKENNTYLVGISDFQDWEKQHGLIPERGVVFINFGWEQYYPERKAFLGIRNNTGYNFPGIHPDAAEFLVERDIYGVGVDSPSLDGSLSVLRSHWKFFENNIWGLEAVANVSNLPPTGARVTVLPMKIRGGSGGPTRVYAVWDDESGCTSLHQSATALLVVCLMILILLP